jgi:hypothetical protein
MKTDSPFPHWPDYAQFCLSEADCAAVAERVENHVNSCCDCQVAPLGFCPTALVMIGEATQVTKRN